MYCEDFWEMKKSIANLARKKKGGGEGEENIEKTLHICDSQNEWKQVENNEA